MMCMFHLIMVSIPSSLIFSAKNRVRVSVCVCVVLDRQNLLSDESYLSMVPYINFGIHAIYPKERVCYL